MLKNNFLKYMKGMIKMVKANSIRLSEKFLLSFEEASLYFGIGENKLRNMAGYKERIPNWIVMNGTHKLIKRSKLEEFLLEAETI